MIVGFLGEIINIFFWGQKNVFVGILGGFGATIRVFGKLMFVFV
jgi:hypothetical protein